MEQNKKTALPYEKPFSMIGRPPATAITYRKVVDGILYVLRTGCQWKIKHSDDVQVVANVIDNSVIKQPFVSNKPKEEEEEIRTRWKYMQHL